MVRLRELVETLQRVLQRSHDNLNEIRSILIPLVKQPLFERKNGKINESLYLDDREEILSKRHDKITDSMEKISDLLNQNMELFGLGGRQQHQNWQIYIQHVDQIVWNYLYQSVGCR